MNFVKAVGKAIVVRSRKIEERKVRMDRIPMSVWVRALVFATTM